MAFDLANAINNAKSKLNSVSTRVVSQDGMEIVEKRGKDGTFQEVADDTVPISNRRRKHVERARRFGYVLDLKPDLQVAQIEKGVCLSSQDVVNNLDLLRAHNVTHIVNAGVGIANVFPKKFEYLNVEVLDLPDADIRSKFELVHQFIQKAVDLEGNCLVHCNAGVSRSATFVLSYLMCKYRLSLTNAFTKVRAIRPAIRPNDGFQRQLENYEKELELDT